MHGKIIFNVIGNESFLSQPQTFNILFYDFYFRQFMSSVKCRESLAFVPEY